MGDVAYWIGSAVGGLIDSEKSFFHLLQQTNIPLVVLAQKKDPVIPVGARLIEVASKDSRVLVHETNSCGHANLDRTARKFLEDKIFS